MVAGQDEEEEEGAVRGRGGNASGYLVGRR
jgi:hypothetical protein